MIKIKDLVVEINKKEILKNVNITIPENKIVSIVGVNGCGKTTLLKTIVSLQKYSGTISVNNTNINTLSYKEKAKIFSYLPQNYIVPNISVNDLLIHGRFPHLDFNRKLSNKDYEIINNAIKITNISSIVNKKLQNLSGGERQRSYIAMNIVQNSNVILLDEPTTFLDISYQLEIFNIVKKLKKENKTIIMVLHDLQQAFTFSDLLIVVNQGRVIAFDTPSNILNMNILKTTFGVNLDKDNNNNLYSYILKKEAL